MNSSSNIARDVARKIAKAKEHLKRCNGTVGGMACYECVASRGFLKKHKVKA